MWYCYVASVTNQSFTTNQHGSVLGAAMQENRRMGETIGYHREAEAQTPGGTVEVPLARNIWTETTSE